MPKLLLTGFDPFAHYQKNPSWEVAQALPNALGNFEIVKLLLPNIYGLAGKMLLAKAQEVQPDVILMLGMDSGSTHVHLDTVAVNLRDALVEDNLGRRPWGEPVIFGGPAAYFSTLPVHQIVRELQNEKIPVHLGYTTGGYVCNDIFYTACYHCAKTNIKVGFAHVPLLPEMVWDANLALPLERSTKLVQAIILKISQILAKK